MALPTIAVTPGSGATINSLPPGGQALGASSLPVVIASDQSAVPISPQDAKFVAGSPFSLSSAGVLFSQDTTGYNSITVQITSAGTGCTITYETSIDNINWNGCSGLATNGSGGSAPTGASTTAATYIFPCNGQYFRARVSTYGSGTVTVNALLRAAPAPANIGAYVGGGLIAASATSAALGMTVSRIKSAASTNATNVKAVAGSIYDLTISNTSAAAKYFKLYNKGTAPTVGTDTPTFTVQVAAGATYAQSFTIPLRFSTGIAYAITGAVADTDTTATAVDDVHGQINWI